MRLTRNRAIAGLAAVLLVIGIVYAGRWLVLHDQAQQQHGRDAKTEAAAAPYADPAACAVCHDQIAATYSLTGMARSFAKVRQDKPLADFQIHNRLHHAASDRYYAMIERRGKFFQRRHEVGFGVKETNEVEFEVDYVVGSGNHARTFLHRSTDGRLFEMPVSWYAKRGGYWEMSPGYDRSAHPDFRRLINEDCMSCHNGSPNWVQDDGNGPRFDDQLGEGIDCQRCHGPGQTHVDAIKANDLIAGRRAIANPRTFDRARQLETCMQCHLETTSSPLPFQIRRYEHPPFSYTPGKTLSDYFIHFDHAPGSGREDKFEIAGGAYRLRKSPCFQRCEMMCVTCHNPHDIPRGAKAAQFAIGMVAALFGLAIALQTVVEVVQQLRDLDVTDRMMALSQGLRDHPRALAGPAQRGLGVAPRVGLDQRFQGLEQGRGRLRDRFATCARTTDATLRQWAAGVEFSDAFEDGLA